VEDYQALQEQSALTRKIRNLEENISDDELDIVAHEEVEQHYGALEA
jgi:hypothetical protein